jgi:hypothetical protein
MSIKTYKGFDKDLKCRGFQYEIGKEYEEKEASACNCGFHACEMPIEVLGYYEPGKQSRYCEVEQSGDLSREGSDSKVASTKIKIGAEIGIPGIVKAQFEYVKERAKESNRHHSTGYWSANSATGSRSANSATGDWSANSATGYGYANISTGFDCSNAGLGERNISVAWGKDSKCKGSVGSFLVLSEWGEFDGEKYPFIGAKMVHVDGKRYKADTWYELRNGKVVKAK